MVRSVQNRFHYRNIETQETSVLRHLAAANEQFDKIALLSGDRRELAHKRAAGFMGLAAYAAENAAILRGETFTLLANRDRATDEICEINERLHGDAHLHSEALNRADLARKEREVA